LGAAGETPRRESSAFKESDKQKGRSVCKGGAAGGVEPPRNFRRILVKGGKEPLVRV